MENESLTSSHRRRAIRDALRVRTPTEELGRVVLWELYGVVKKIQKDYDLEAIFDACGDRRRLRALASKAYRHDGLDLLVDVLAESGDGPRAFKEFLCEEVRRGVDIAVRDVVSSGDGPTLSDLSQTTEDLILRVEGDLEQLATKVLEAPRQPVRRPRNLGRRSMDTFLNQSLLGSRP